jgi:hypothetical protein
MASLALDQDPKESWNLYSCSSTESISSLALSKTGSTPIITANSINTSTTPPGTYQFSDGIFFYFNSLPLSIRLRIWDLILPAGRIIPLSHQTHSPLPTPLAYICRQTRYMVLSRTRPLYPENWGWQEHDPYVYIAPQHDTLLIDLHEKSLKDSLESLSDKVVPDLKSIALRRWEVMFEQKSRAAWTELECLLGIPNLCRLNLVFVSERNLGFKELDLVSVFTMVTTDWPDELDEEDLELLVREEVAGCCRALSFEELRYLKVKVAKIQEVLRTFKAMEHEWKMPRVRVRLLVGTEQQRHAYVVPKKRFNSNWW